MLDSTLWVGRKPTKRTYEMLCFYFQGWASLAELTAQLNPFMPIKKLGSSASVAQPRLPITSGFVLRRSRCAEPPPVIRNRPFL